jgi:hypothetical protein
MATLNLGRIKPVFQGAYNSLTAYVVDDIVTFGGETFICILASTGNATSSATYWSKLAKKGDDVTQLTTQGDILYRDASGVARLPAGINGQVLQTKGAGQNPIWASASSVLWEYKEANFTAAAGGAYIINTTSGEFTMTLPSTPADNDQVLFVDSFGTWATSPLTVAQAGGYRIANANENLTCDQSYATIRLTFKTTPDVTSSYIGWLLT